MKRVLKVGGGLLALVLVIVSGLLIYVSAFLPNAEPAPDLKVELTEERIQRGKHLASNVMLCTHCHTPQDKTRYADPIDESMLGAGGVLFGKDEGMPGDIYSRNITPAALGDWTDGEIFRAITQGVSKDGSALFPIMPWPNYARLDEEDIKDVIAYIRTLEPIRMEHPAPEYDFPMNLIVNMMPEPPAFTEKPDPANKVEYGKYLVTAGSCSDCHTQWEGSTPKDGMYLAGGNPFRLKTGGTVLTANLTPHPQSGLGLWTEEMFIQRFKAHQAEGFEYRKIGENEFGTPMPWGQYSQMSEEELGAIYAYLQSVDPVENMIVRFTPDPEIN